MRGLQAHAERLGRRRSIVVRPRCLGMGGLSLDYGGQRVDAAALAGLYDWAGECAVQARLQALMAGAKVNGRLPALHTALRGTPAARAPGIARRMQGQLRKALDYADAIRTRPVGGVRYTDVVNLGVGGSEQGPKLLVEACGHGGPAVHFVAGPDGLGLDRLLSRLDPQRTLFIVASKSFSTWETLLNARAAREWLCAQAGAAAVGRNMVGVSANGAAMRDFGLRRCLRIEPSVGGRYSVWSAMGLAGMIGMGTRAYGEFLEGGRDVDERVGAAAAARNPAVLMALLDAWNIGFLGATSRVLLVFDERLSALVAYLGQLEMESLGKSEPTHAGMHCSGVPLWGGTVHAARHSYFQLLYQGQSRFTADLILVRRAARRSLQPRRDALLRRAGEYARLLARGPGGRAHNLLWMNALTPRALGKLLALYEHKVYALSVLWGINAFDQPFVDALRR